MAAGTRIAGTVATVLLLVAAAGSPAHGRSAPTADALPHEPSDLLLVGDSVTAGIYFMGLCDASVRQGWAGQLMLRLGLEPDSCHLERFYPLDQLALAQRGFGWGGLRYPWEALPALFPKKSRFRADEERTILAVPGQMVHEVLVQSSRNKGHDSAGWTFGAILLPPGLSAIETIEQWKKRPRWIVLFIGANDLLASFGLVGGAQSPSVEEFRRDYEELVRRLRAVMAADAGPDHLLVLTLPDVTRLPLLQPVPEGARDGRGHVFLPGSMASTFLLPFRADRLHADEVWTPDELQAVRTRGSAYNQVILDIAVREGLTVVPLTDLIAGLSRDPAFASPDSPYFSPDLHHPSYRTHAAIAAMVLDHMAEVTGAPLPDDPSEAESEVPLPTNADLPPPERRRVDTLMRLALLGLKDGPLPPEPTLRADLEFGAQFASHRAGDGAGSILVGLESNPSPVHDRWLSRGGLHARGSALVVEDGDVRYFPRSSLEIRAGVAVEPIGAWSWSRIAAGVLLAAEGGFGWYGRGEWRRVYAEVSSRGLAPDRLEAGLRLGWLFGRPGRIGN